MAEHEDAHMNGTTLTARVNSASENAYAKLLSRVILPPMLAAVGGLAMWTLSDIRADIDKTRQYVSTINEQMHSARTDIEVTKEDLKQYRERQDDIRKALEDSIRNLDNKVENVRGLLQGQATGPIRRN